MIEEGEYDYIFPELEEYIIGGRCDEPCVYFLFEFDETIYELVYIGKADLLEERINMHIKSNKEFNKIFYYPILNKFDRDNIESFFISQYEPKYNGYKINEIKESMTKNYIPENKKTYRKRALNQSISISLSGSSRLTWNMIQDRMDELGIKNFSRYIQILIEKDIFEKGFLRRLKNLR